MPIVKPIKFLRYVGRTKVAKEPWRHRLMHGAIVMVHPRQVANKLIPVWTRGRGYIWTIKRQFLQPEYVRNPEPDVSYFRYFGPTLRPGRRGTHRPALYHNAIVMAKQGEAYSDQDTLQVVTRGKGYRWSLPQGNLLAIPEYEAVPRADMLAQNKEIRQAVAIARRHGIEALKKKSVKLSTLFNEGMQELGDLEEHFYHLPEAERQQLVEKLDSENQRVLALMDKTDRAKRMLRAAHQYLNPTIQNIEWKEEWDYKSDAELGPIEAAARAQAVQDIEAARLSTTPKVQQQIPVSYIQQLQAARNWADRFGPEWADQYMMYAQYRIIPTWGQFIKPALQYAKLQGKPITEASEAMKAAAAMWRGLKEMKIPHKYRARKNPFVEPFLAAIPQGAGVGAGVIGVQGILKQLTKRRRNVLSGISSRRMEYLKAAHRALNSGNIREALQLFDEGDKHLGGYTIKQTNDFISKARTIMAQRPLDYRNPQRYKTVADIPDDFELVTNSQDVRAVAEMIGKKLPAGHAGLFVKLGEGEYIEAYSFPGEIPWLDKPVKKLLNPASYLSSQAAKGNKMRTAYKTKRSKSRRELDYNPYLTGEAVDIPGIGTAGTVIGRATVGGGLFGGGIPYYQVKTNEPSPRTIIVREQGLKPVGRNPSTYVRLCPSCRNPVSFSTRNRTTTCKQCHAKLGILA